MIYRRCYIIVTFLYSNILHVTCYQIQSNHIENIFHSQLHHPGQIPISEAGVFVNSVVDKSSGQKYGKKPFQRCGSYDPLTKKEYISYTRLIQSKCRQRKVQPISKKRISYIHLLASCSNLTHLSSSSPFLKTIWSQRDIIQVPTVHPYHTLLHSIPF